LSEFTSTFELFTSVVEQEALQWSSPNNVLQDFLDASTWDQNGGMLLSSPKIPIPGGTPVINAITINDLQIQIRWARGGNAGSGGGVFLRHFDIGGGEAVGQFTSVTELEPFHTDQIGGDLTFWNVTQNQMKDFINGTNPFVFNIDTSGINGATQTRVAWIKASIQYTYTGSGIGFPRLF
jgi:hypothetical protein